MEKLIEFTFDFFGHVIPGLIILIALSLLLFDIGSLEGLFNQAKSIETSKIPTILLPAYIFGFAANPIGKFLYQKVGKKIWKPKIDDHKEMCPSDKFIMIREESPINFKYIEKWNTYCAMAHNLAVGFLLLFFVVLTKLDFKDSSHIKPWIIIALSSLVLFFVFIQRATLFSTWAINDLNATVKKVSSKTSSE